MEILQARILEWVATPHPPPGHLPNPGIKARSPTLQEESLPSVPPGKPKNTGVGSLSLLQGLFPTQESNPGLPHCRQILYQLNYQYLPQKYLLEIFTKMSHKKKTEKPVRCVTRLSFLFHEPGRSDGKITSEQSMLCRGPSLRNPHTYGLGLRVRGETETVHRQQSSHRKPAIGPDNQRPPAG